MKIKELIRQLSTMNPELDAYISIYQPGDCGEQDHFELLAIVEYTDGKEVSEHHVQIKGG